MVFNAMCVKLGSFNGLPDVMKHEMAVYYAGYDKAPPAADLCHNEITWTAVIKKVKAQR